MRTEIHIFGTRGMQVTREKQKNLVLVIRCLQNAIFSMQEKEICISSLELRPSHDEAGGGGRGFLLDKEQIVSTAEEAWAFHMASQDCG